MNITKSRVLLTANACDQWDLWSLYRLHTFPCHERCIYSQDAQRTQPKACRIPTALHDAGAYRALAMGSVTSSCTCTQSCLLVKKSEASQTPLLGRSAIFS